METSPHCTVSPGRNPSGLLWLPLLTFAVLLVNGYHPWAEDGGLYVAGVEHLLNPALFPVDTAFVTEHLRYSVYAPLLAATVRLSHLSLPAVLFAAYLLSTALMLFAALRLAERCIATRAGQWFAVVLLAAWWTLPVAGTSLLLMDPYVTARSFSTPLTLLAVGAALDPWVWSGALFRLRSQGNFGTPVWSPTASPILVCVVALLAAALFHPLMAGYGLGLVLFVRLERSTRTGQKTAALSAVVLTGAACLQALGKPESVPSRIAIYSRYYWFLSQWQWYEWLGLLGPIVIFAALARWKPGPLQPVAFTLCRAMLRLTALSVLAAVLFAHEHFRSHLVASLQPLREFVLFYAVLIVLLGGLLSRIGSFATVTTGRNSRRAMQAIPVMLLGLMALTMYLVQRTTFPSSIHVEAPGRTNPNPWVRAFLWVREHTPNDALFALDARYINTDGEDAQTFRAIARRSALPDFSKDGGEAAIAPALADNWLRAATATKHLSDLSDGERDALLLPLGVHWVVLHAEAQTRHVCPYRNDSVKVCTLTSPLP